MKANMDLKERLMQEIKLAMKNADKTRLSVLRLVSAELKQIEVDERCVLDYARIVKILQNMKKQRQDSLLQYQKADRADLAAQEDFEISVINEFLPEPFSHEELSSLVQQAIREVSAQVVSDIPKIMAWLEPHIEGRASSKELGAVIRKELESVHSTNG